MTIFTTTPDGKLAAVPALSCARLSLCEADLREGILSHPEQVLGTDILVIGQEVIIHADGERMRLDLLAVTRDVRPLIVEIKMSPEVAKGLFDQVQRYVLGAAGLTWRDLLQIHQRQSRAADPAILEASLRQFANIQGGIEPVLGRPMVWVLAPEGVRIDSADLTRLRMAQIELHRMEIQAGRGPHGMVVAIASPPPTSLGVNTAQATGPRRTVFWGQFLSVARSRGAFINVKKTPKFHVSESSGTRGIRYRIRVKRREVRIDANVDLGDRSGRETRELYRKLYNRRGAIESRLGLKLTWSHQNGTRARDIIWHFADRGLNVENHRWPALCAEIVRAYVKFRGAFEPELADLNR